jgi:hypothetical protein
MPGDSGAPGPAGSQRRGGLNRRSDRADERMLARDIRSRAPEGKHAMRRKAARDPVVKPKPKPEVTWRFTDWAAI